MIHLAAYSGNFASTTTLGNLPAVTDTILTTRNNDFIVTDDFRLGLAYGLGSTITELRFNWPTLNAYGFHQIYEYDYQGTTIPLPPDRPALIDYISQPMVVPKDEQLDVQITNAPATTEQDTLLVWLFTPNHSYAIPAGIQRLTIRATYAFTPAAAYAWSGAQVLTFETTFRGGWYYIVGMDVFDAKGVAARLIFPKGTPYNGRVLRPGVICRSVISNRSAERFIGRLGVFGFFNSFEQPYIEVLANAASALAGKCAFDVVYAGDGSAPGPLS